MQTLDVIEASLMEYMRASSASLAINPPEMRLVPLKNFSVIRYLLDVSDVDASDASCETDMIESLKSRYWNFLMKHLSLNAATAEDESQPADERERSGIVADRIARVTAILCGRGCAGVMSRPWTLYNPPNGEPIEIRIREPDITTSDLGWKTWGGSLLLTRLILMGRIEIARSIDSVMELGCGTGLVGLSLGKITASNTHITMTDFHPGVLANAEVNVSENNLNDKISVEKVDWFSYLPRHASYDSSAAINGPKYSIILAADVIYNNDHAESIPYVVAAHLKRSPESVFHCVLPLRPQYRSEVTLFETAMRNAGFVLGSEPMDIWEWEVDATPANRASVISDEGELNDPMCRFGVWYRVFEFRLIN